MKIMVFLIGVGFLASSIAFAEEATSASVRADLEKRVSALESRVANLESLAASPSPKSTSVYCYGECGKYSKLDGLVRIKMIGASGQTEALALEAIVRECDSWGSTSDTLGYYPYGVLDKSSMKCAAGNTAQPTPKPEVPKECDEWAQAMGSC